MTRFSISSRLILYNSRWQGSEFLNDVTLTRRCAPPSPKGRGLESRKETPSPRSQNEEGTTDNGRSSF